MAFSAEAKIQVQKLKQFNEKQHQELRQILDIRDRLQRTAAEMNTLHFRTNASVDIETLSQQLSQIPADLSGCQTQDRGHVSPARHRTKRSRFDDDPMDQVSPLQVPLRDNVNLTNRIEQEREVEKDICCSITQDEEDEASNQMRKEYLDSEVGSSVLEDQAFRSLKYNP